MKFFALVLLLIAVGCSHESHVLGRMPAPSQGETRITSLGQAAIGEATTLHGVMVEKCPVAGCWFTLRDKTGTIKVDTKGAGFVVVDVPLNKELIVAGVVRTNIAGLFVEGSGLQY